jgi:hypothetical protein
MIWRPESDAPAGASIALTGVQQQLLAAVAVAVRVEAVVIVADDRYGAGVTRAVAAASFAVIVGGIWVETGAAVAGIAFARFSFGGFFGFCFFACFGSFTRPLAYRDSSCAAARLYAPFPGIDSPRFPPAALFGGSASFQCHVLPRFLFET